MKTIGHFVSGSLGHCKAADLTVSGGALGKGIAGPTGAVVLLSAQLDLSGLHPF